MNWSKQNVFSSLFLCWGAKAALKYFHDIDSVRGDKKTFGLFEHRLLADKTGLTFGFPDVFSAPVSRWKSPRRVDIERVTELEIVADSAEAGPNMLVEARAYDDGTSYYPRRTYVMNHPEYDTEILRTEYERDSALDPETPLPAHYFPQDDPTQLPLNTWRYSAILYTNWIKGIYAAAPYDMAQIPQPYLSQG